MEQQIKTHKEIDGVLHIDEENVQWEHCDISHCYGQDDDGTITVRVVRAWHQPSNHSIMLYRGNTLLETKSISDTEADYSFTGLDADLYTILIRDQDVKDNYNVNCDRYVDVQVPYGGGSNIYDAGPHDGAH